MTDLHGTHPIQRRDPATAARVAREQLSFVVTSAGRSWIVLLLFGVLLTWAAASRGFPAHSFAVLLALLTSSIITGAAWPSRPGSDGRTYFRSLPGSRPHNIAMRTAGLGSSDADGSLPLHDIAPPRSPDRPAYLVVRSTAGWSHGGASRHVRAHGYDEAPCDMGFRNRLGAAASVTTRRDGGD